MNKYETVLVLGGTGFLGKNLQKVRPDWVYVGRSHFVEDGVICEGNVPPWDWTNYDDVYDVISGFDPDAVINLAADVGGIKYNKENQLSIFENNIMMNTNIIKACRELEIDRVLSCLSTCVFPDGDRYPMNEDNLFKSVKTEHDYLGQPVAECDIHPFKGHMGYGWSKRMLQMHTELAREAGYNYSTFTPSNLYGPYDHMGEDAAHFVAALIDKVTNLKEEKCGCLGWEHPTATCTTCKDLSERGSGKFIPLRLFGDGKPLRQFLYAPDLADIIPELLEKHNSGLPLIVAPDENLSIDEMAKIALEVVNKEAQIVYSGEHSGQYRKDCSNQKFKKMFPDFQFTSFREGLRKTYGWYKENS